jgi:hypothetical protein
LLKLKSKYPNLEINQEFLINKENEYLLNEKIKHKNTIISMIQNSDFYKKDDIRIPKIKIDNKIIKNTK